MAFPLPASLPVPCQLYCLLFWVGAFYPMNMLLTLRFRFRSSLTLPSPFPQRPISQRIPLNLFATTPNLHTSASYEHYAAYKKEAESCKYGTGLGGNLQKDGKRLRRDSTYAETIQERERA